MKKLFVILVIISLFGSFNNSSNQNKTKSHEIQSIGANKDKNGCLTAAGQTWSQIKNDCIQVFSVGIRLNPIKIDSSEAIISAFLVQNEDSTAYELVYRTLQKLLS